MKYIGQMITIMSIILMGASFDGYACELFGFGGLLARLAVFGCSFMVGLAVEKKARLRSKASNTAVCRRSEEKRSDCVQMRATHEREQAVKKQEKSLMCGAHKTLINNK